MEHNSKLAAPITITLESQGVVDLLTGLVRSAGVATIVAFHADSNEWYGVLHHLEQHCSGGLPEIKVSLKKK